MDVLGFPHRGAVAVQADRQPDAGVLEQLEIVAMDAVEVLDPSGVAVTQRGRHDDGLRAGGAPRVLRREPLEGEVRDLVDSGGECGPKIRRRRDVRGDAEPGGASLRDDRRKKSGIKALVAEVRRIISAFRVLLRVLEVDLHEVGLRREEAGPLALERGGIVDEVVSLARHPILRPVPEGALPCSGLVDLHRMAARRSQPAVRVEDVERHGLVQLRRRRCRERGRVVRVLHVEHAVGQKGLELAIEVLAAPERVVVRVGERRDDVGSVQVERGLDLAVPRVSKYAADREHRAGNERSPVEPAPVHELEVVALAAMRGGKGRDRDSGQERQQRFVKSHAL
jgi:hypothetical protein